MNLIEIKTNEKLEQVVSARDLYEKLGLDKANWSRWSNKNIIEDDLFTENVDYTGFVIMKNGNETKDFMLKIEMAKELAMMCRTEKGKEIRQYFIQVEKAWNSPDMIMARALKNSENILLGYKEQVKMLELENKNKDQIIEDFKPVKEYVDEILKTDNTMCITQIAADYGMTAIKLNQILYSAKFQRKVNKQWVLYAVYLDKEYTKSTTFNIKKKDANNNITEKVVVNTQWTQKGRLKIHDILSKIGIKAKMDVKNSKGEC